jgi:hypothetical protein
MLCHWAGRVPKLTEPQIKWNRMLSFGGPGPEADRTSNKMELDALSLSGSGPEADRASNKMEPDALSLGGPGPEADEVSYKMELGALSLGGPGPELTLICTKCRELNCPYISLHGMVLGHRGHYHMHTNVYDFL